jgi:hypothetical protein
MIAISALRVINALTSPPKYQYRGSLTSVQEILNVNMLHDNPKKVSAVRSSTKRNVIFSSTKKQKNVNIVIENSLRPESLYLLQLEENQNETRQKIRVYNGINIIMQLIYNRKVAKFMTLIRLEAVMV